MNKISEILISFVAGCLILIVGAGIIMALNPQPVAELEDWIIGGLNAPTSVIFSGGIHESWLRVERHNLKDYEQKGFDPCYTTIQSDFKPIITRIGDKWEVTFVSEIAQSQP